MIEITTARKTENGCHSCVNVQFGVTAVNCIYPKDTQEPFFFSCTRVSPLTAGCSTWAVMPAEPDSQDGRLMKASDSSPWGMERTHTVLLAQKGNKCWRKTIIPQSFPILWQSWAKTAWGWRLQGSRGQLWTLTYVFKRLYAEKLNLQTEIIYIYM